MIKIKLIPAGYGMSILVSVGGVHTINILIDGGTSNSYSNGLKKEVDNIIAFNEKINLVVCTHIDHDHISGLTKLLMDGYGTHIEKIWYTGDLVYKDMLTAWFPSTDPQAYLQSLEKVAKLPVRRVFPAHHSLNIHPEILIRMRDKFRQLKTNGQLHHGSGIFDYGDWSVWL